jgi:hypothetical protein
MKLCIVWNHWNNDDKAEESSVYGIEHCFENIRS